MRGWTARQLLSHLGEVVPEIRVASFTMLEPATKETAPADFDPAHFVPRALNHRGYPEPIYEVPVSELSSAMNGSPPPNKVRALCSRATLIGGRAACLGLLDFRCEVSEHNTRALLTAMRLLGEHHGALLSSGRSFHYYGFRPRDPHEWLRFMANAVLLGPLTDIRHIAHSLIDGMACLRIDAHPAHPFEPIVLEYLQ